MTTTKTVIAVVSNAIRIDRSTVGPDLLSELRYSLTRENPQYHQIKRMRDRNKRMMYAKLPPMTVTSFEEDEHTIYIPRGFKRDLIEIAERHNQTVKFHDETVVFERDVGMQLSSDIILKEYQRKGVGALVMAREGVLVAPCGGGKTVAGIAIITTLKQPTLVLTHTHDLVDQWRRELGEKALIPGGVGTYTAGKRGRGQVIIATIQTLFRLPSSVLKDYLDQFGCVILDEAHHCPADTFLGIINLCSSRYRFGLTATPKRKDGLQFLMTDTIGPITASITDDDLTKEGRSQTCVVRNVPTTFYTTYTADEWTLLLGELTRDVDRNRIIVEEVYKCWQDGHFPLVLSDRVSHCRHLNEELCKRGMNSQLLIGELPKGVRSDTVCAAKSGLVDAIVATSVADEGLDIPTLSCVHITTPTGNESRLQQRIGRIRRPIEGKVSLIVDYIDLRVAACTRMARSRKSLYRQWGFHLEDGRQI